MSAKYFLSNSALALVLIIVTSSALTVETIDFNDTDAEALIIYVLGDQDYPGTSPDLCREAFEHFMTKTEQSQNGLTLRKLLVKKIVAKLEVVNSRHDHYYLATFLGELGAREKIIALMEKEKLFSCHYGPELVMALASCGTIFDVPVLIDAIDKESDGCAGIVNQALQKLTNCTYLEVNDRGYIDKSAWQQWWDKNSKPSYNHKVNIFYADWFFEHKQFDQARYYYEQSLTEEYDYDVPSRNNAYYERAKSRIELIDENCNDYDIEPLYIYIDSLLKEDSGIWQESIDLLESIKNNYPDSNIVDDADFAIARAVSFLEGREAAIEYWRKFISDYPNDPRKKKAQESIIWTYYGLAADCLRENQDQQAEQWYRLILQQPILSDDGLVYLEIARFFEQRGNLDLAEKAYIMQCFGYSPLVCGYYLGEFYERHYDFQTYVDFLKANNLDVERLLKEYREGKR